MVPRNMWEHIFICQNKCWILLCIWKQSSFLFSVYRHWKNQRSLLLNIWKRMPACQQRFACQKILPGEIAKRECQNSARRLPEEIASYCFPETLTCDNKNAQGMVSGIWQRASFYIVYTGIRLLFTTFHVDHMKKDWGRDYGWNISKAFHISDAFVVRWYMFNVMDLLGCCPRVWWRV